MTEPEQPTSKVARDTAVSSLISNGVYLAVMIGLAVEITRRDWVVRQAARLQGAIRQEWRGYHTAREVADFRRDISEWEHRARGDG